MNSSIDCIRRAFLSFFCEKGHKIIPSSSLIPNNDSTLLFTNAGMNQFKDVFLGFNKLNYSRATTSQRCVRIGGKHNDLENVGYTECHNTFFEMLGNFSFGDYFKEEAIQYAWELLTCKNWFNLSKDKLLVSVYETDNETYKIWEKKIGISRDRIIRVGNYNNIPYSSDNFWQMSKIGPCGPCTEILYDHGDHILEKSLNDTKNRYTEIWNIVFIQFNRKDNGTIEPLNQLFVDTGMGLERISAILQGVNSIYEIDIFRKLIKSVAKVTDTIDLNNRSLRVIADHIRSCSFLIADGVIPSNENRGYALRRIIRRAVRHGYLLGVKESFFYKLVDPLVEAMGEIGKNVKLQKKKIEYILNTEENQFFKTMENGLIVLEKKLSALMCDTLDGKTIFHLYDTYGFPIELTSDICRERNIKIDKIGFKKEMEKQRIRSRQSGFFIYKKNKIIHTNYISEFHGYNYFEMNCIIIGIFIDGKEVDSICSEQESILILNKTPFYAESGGQIGDYGQLKGDNFIFIVKDTQKYGKAFVHIGKLVSGSLKLGDTVFATIDKLRRIRICLNHSATHLMHASLREIIGDHVIQKGSLINENMLRFDFSHFKAMSSAEIYKVENLVNEKIRSNFLIETNIMSLKSAKSKQAIALFDEKYDKYVRVVNINNFSIELCCGTHATRTGDIGLFHIVSESSIALGIRRIEAVTGENAINHFHKKNDILYDTAKLLKINCYNLPDKVHSMLSYTSKIEKELKKLESEIANQNSINLYNTATEIKKIKVIVSKIENANPKILRNIINNLKDKLGSVIIVLASIIKEKLFFVGGVSKDITYKITAEKLINIIANQINGKGGGCASLAQVYGENIIDVSIVLDNVKIWITKRLNNTTKL